MVQACGATTSIIATTQMSLLEDSMKSFCEKITKGAECLGELGGGAHNRAPSSSLQADIENLR